MNRIVLTLSYDGASYAGWQTQPSGLTVQDKLEAAIQSIQGQPAATICAGRTDAGVHALAQVVHFDTAVVRPLSAWVRGVNAHLPTSIAVHSAQLVEPSFNARMSATARTYNYLIIESTTRQPLWQGRAGWSFRSLEPALMQQAAQAVQGTYDFTSLRSSQCQAATPIRTISECRVMRRGQFILIRVKANAFLHHMVRNLVGCLVQIGQGKRSVSWMAEVIEQRDRKFAAPTYAPDGLYLTDVEYPSEFAIRTGLAINPLPISFPDHNEHFENTH